MLVPAPFPEPERVRLGYDIILEPQKFSLLSFLAEAKCFCLTVDTSDAALRRTVYGHFPVGEEGKIRVKSSVEMNV